jgi:hypothetical protein
MASLAVPAGGGGLVGNFIFEIYRISVVAGLKGKQTPKLN